MEGNGYDFVPAATRVLLKQNLMPAPLVETYQFLRRISALIKSYQTFILFVHIQRVYQVRVVEDSIWICTN